MPKTSKLSDFWDKHDLTDFEDELGQHQSGMAEIQPTNENQTTYRPA